MFLFLGHRDVQIDSKAHGVESLYTDGVVDVLVNEDDNENRPVFCAP